MFFTRTIHTNIHWLFQCTDYRIIRRAIEKALHIEVNWKISSVIFEGIISFQTYCSFRLPFAHIRLTVYVVVHSTVWHNANVKISPKKRNWNAVLVRCSWCRQSAHKYVLYSMFIAYLRCDESHMNRRVDVRIVHSSTERLVRKHDAFKFYKYFYGT